MTDDLKRRGRQVGRKIQARVAANRPMLRRFPKRGNRLPEEWGTSIDLAWARAGTELTSGPDQVVYT